MSSAAVNGADRGAQEDWTSIERSTQKYWIDTSRVDEVLATIRANLPLYVFGEGNVGEEKKLDDAKVFQSSVYFDNEDFSEYHGRLRRDNDATLLRVRWYSNWLPGAAAQSAPKSFVELKTHRGGWTMGSSSKERFAGGKADEEGIGSFFAAAAGYDCDSAVGEGKNDELKHRVSSIVSRRKLTPKVMTTYRRLAFQRKGDMSLRLTLDQDLRGIAVHGNGGTWFSPKDGAEVVQFPFAVLEVKREVAGGDAGSAILPDFLEQAQADGWLVAVPKFSKYVHSACMLRGADVPALPGWLMSDWMREQQQRLLAPSLAKNSVSPSPVDTKKDPVVVKKVADVPKSAPSRFARMGAKVAAGTGMAGGKGTVINMRVEPKTFFANERTFLQWVNTLATLMALCLGLMQLEMQVAVNIHQAFDDETNTSLSGLLSSTQWLPSATVALMAACFTLLMYSFWMYRRRAACLTGRLEGPYDDQRGPPILVLLIVAVLMVNIQHTMQLNNEIAAILDKNT